jgi:two-component system phosphate regulon sensor histidine kinase PhoR
MRPGTFKIILAICSLALIGLVVTQTFWIRKEIDLNQKQFDHRVDKALADVLDELSSYANNRSCDFRPHDSCAHACMSASILAVVDTSLLKVLFRKYITYHQLDPYYSFAIVRSSNDSVVFSSGKVGLTANISQPYRACMSCLYKEDYFHLALYFPNKKKSVLADQFIWLALTFVFLIIITSGVALIVITYLRQKKLNEMKSDFINNISHELKTPVSTIALAAEVLIKEQPGQSVDRIVKYAKIIHDENERMRQHLDRVLELAQQDDHNYRLTCSEINIHELIENVVAGLLFKYNYKEIKPRFQLHAVNPVLLADCFYITGIVTNITENAIKYSHGDPELTIITSDDDKGIKISFMDKGIGIAREAQKHIFEKFYRVPTGDVHDVKGFGLGLYFAKTMTEVHGGTIEVSSELNKGSRFDVYIPRKRNQTKI